MPIIAGLRPTLAALGAAALVLLTACTAPPVELPAQPGAPPAELAGFYDQQPTFGPCAPYATTAPDEKLFANDRLECARVQVPLDYADPDGPRGEVALLRSPARGDKIGTLLVNPGGPGASGMNLVAAVDPLWSAGPIGERFDVVGFDPRGVGATTPRADCYTDAEYDRGDGFSGGANAIVTDEQQAREIARRCTEASGGPQVLTSVGTSDVVRDMDVLRAVLGDEKLTYLGYSYGTELGAMYAEQFPDRVRAMVLDGAVDPDTPAAELPLTQFSVFQSSFDELAAGCAADPDCPLGTDPARATEALHALVRPLQESPASTVDPRGLTYDDAMTGVLTGLRGEDTWPAVVQGLTELAAGRGDELLGLRDTQYQRGPDGRYGYDADVLTSIRCMDTPRRTPAEQTAMTKELYTTAPILDPGRPFEETYHECSAWPAPPSRSEPWLTGDADVPPTLTVSVTGDVATPHQGGINLARMLRGSLLTVEGKQHGVALLAQSECVDGIVTDYLIDLQTPPADARCVL